MHRHLFFKKRRDVSSLSVWGSILFVLVIAATAGGCSSAPCRLEGDRGNVGLCGPVRSMLLEMGGSEVDSVGGSELQPREYREFDRQGRLIRWMKFGKSIADTTSIMQRFYNAKGQCVKMLQGTPGPKRRWKWERVEYAYDSTDALLWQVEYQDTFDLVPHTVFCYSSNVDEETECLGRWKNVKTLKVIYQDERNVPLGEQWLLSGKSHGAIRYDVDTIAGSERRYMQYRLPAENVGNEAHRYVANYYDDAGRLIEQWGYIRESLFEGAYSYTDLAEIRRFDSNGRTIFQLSVGNDTASQMYRTSFEFDERGNMQRSIRTTYASFGAFMRGEIQKEEIEDRFEYGALDKHGNWGSSRTIGRSGQTKAAMRRTFEYY